METIIIFAAGRGTRMEEATRAVPKSLLEIHNKPLLQYALESTEQYKFDRIIINTHYLHKQIEEFIRAFVAKYPNFPEIILEYEKEPLETGGTVKKLAKLYDLGEKVFTLNSDVIMRSDSNLFEDLNSKWDASKMDLLLLLQDTDEAFGYVGSGDFYLNADGTIHRNREAPYPCMFTGMQMLNPQKIAQIPEDIFSLRECYPQIGKFSQILEVRAIQMDGQWYHATRPQDLLEIEKHLAK